MVSHVNRLTDQVKAADNVGNFLVDESKIIKPAQFVSSPGQNLDVLVEYMAYALASREKDGIYHTYIAEGGAQKGKLKVGWICSYKSYRKQNK